MSVNERMARVEVQIENMDKRLDKNFQVLFSLLNEDVIPKVHASHNSVEWLKKGFFICFSAVITLAGKVFLGRN